MGWSGKKNGELLTLMSIDGYEVLLTADQNLRYQQKRAGVAISIVKMIAKTNRIEDLAPVAPAVLLALDAIKTCTVVEVR